MVAGRRISFARRFWSMKLRRSWIFPSVREGLRIFLYGITREMVLFQWEVPTIYKLTGWRMGHTKREDRAARSVQKNAISKMIWKASVPPKILNSILRAAKNILPKRVNLNRRLGCGHTFCDRWWHGRRVHHACPKRLLVGKRSMLSLSVGLGKGSSHCWWGSWLDWSHIKHPWWRAVSNSLHYSLVHFLWKEWKRF